MKLIDTAFVPVIDMPADERLIHERLMRWGRWLAPRVGGGASSSSQLGQLAMRAEPGRGSSGLPEDGRDEAEIEKAVVACHPTFRKLLKAFYVNQANMLRLKGIAGAASLEETRFRLRQARLAVAVRLK